MFVEQVPGFGVDAFAGLQDVGVGSERGEVAGPVPEAVARVAGGEGLAGGEDVAED